MHSLGIVQWNSTRRDHPGNPGGVSGSGLVIVSFNIRSQAVLQLYVFRNLLYYHRGIKFANIKLCFVEAVRYGAFFT